MGEIETEEEKKPFEREENQELEFKKILVRTDKESNFVTQVRFTLVDDNEITYKPKEKVSEIEKDRGLEIVKEYSKSLEMGKLPEKLYEMNNIITEKGKVKVKCSYTIMNTENDLGEEVSYKFFNKKDFEELELL